MQASTSRRTFLGSVAALSVVTPVAIVQAKDSELPEILEAGERLPALVADYRQAAEERERLRDYCEEHRPQAPNELIIRPNDRFMSHMAHDELTVDQQKKWRSSDQPPVKILGYRAIRAEIILHDHSRNTKLGKNLRRLARLAREFEKAEESFFEMSGYEKARGRFWNAETQLENLIYELKDLTPRTYPGLDIYADVVAGYDEVVQRDEGSGGRNLAASALARRMAEGIKMIQHSAG